MSLSAKFDYAICMNNTLGNIKEKEKVIENLKGAVCRDGIVLIGVFLIVYILLNVALGNLGY